MRRDIAIAVRHENEIPPLAAVALGREGLCHLDSVGEIEVSNIVVTGFMVIGESVKHRLAMVIRAVVFDQRMSFDRETDITDRNAPPPNTVADGSVPPPSADRPAAGGSDILPYLVPMFAYVGLGGSSLTFPRYRGNQARSGIPWLTRPNS